MSLPLATTSDERAKAGSADFTVRGAGAFPQVRVYSDWGELPESFLNLFEEAGRQSIFLTLPWFQNLAQTGMGHSDRVRIYCTRDVKGASSGMLLMHSSRESKSFFPLRKLEALANYYSCFYAPHLAVSAGESGGILQALALAIAKEKPHWDAVEVKPMDGDSRDFRELVRAFKVAGFVVQTYFSFGNWYLPVNGRSFAEYSETLPSMLKNTLSRKRKKLEKSGRAKMDLQLEAA